MTYEFNDTNYSNHVFRNFFVRADPGGGPGWYVYGRNKEKYGVKENGDGFYVMLCARPNVPARRHPHYNCAVRRGWRLKREAQAVADELNARFPV